MDTKRKEKEDRLDKQNNTPFFFVNSSKKKEKTRRSNTTDFERGSEDINLLPQNIYSQDSTTNGRKKRNNNVLELSDVTVKEVIRTSGGKDK